MSKLWTTEQIGDSHLYYIKDSLGEKVTAAEKPVADRMIEAVNATLKHSNNLESLLSHIAELHCGTKINGEVTLASVPALVEGQINKQADRADDAERALHDVRNLLGIEYDNIPTLCDTIKTKVIELQSRPTTAKPVKWREPVQAFIDAWQSLDIVARSNDLAPHVKNLRDLLNGK